MKTIFAPKAVIEKWLAALRSGEYKQGKAKLFDRGLETYCCLGVLEHCLEGTVEEARGVPSTQFCNRNGIRLQSEDYWAWGNNPYFPSLKMHATTANDSAGKSFLEIADTIEECAQYTDEVVNEQAQLS